MIARIVFLNRNFFNFLSLLSGGKETKTHSKLSTVTKRIIELKEDFATLHGSSGACEPKPLISSSDSPVEVVIPNGQCVVIKTENMDGDEDDSSLQSEHNESRPSSSVTISHQTIAEEQPNLKPAQLVENGCNKEIVTGNEHNVTSSTTAASSASLEVSSENMTRSSSSSPSQKTLSKKPQEITAAEGSLGGLNDTTSSPATQKLLQKSSLSEPEVMRTKRSNTPSYKHTPSLTGSTNTLGLSRAAQRKRPLFSRVSSSHTMQPKKVRMSAAAEYRQDTNNSVLETDSKRCENERNLIESQRLSLEKERLALEKEKLSMKKERHALKKEKLSLEKQKLFLEIQRLKLELQQINGVKNTDDTTASMLQ